MTRLRLVAFSSLHPAEEMSEKFECFGDVGDDGDGDFEVRGCGWDTWDVPLMSEREDKDADVRTCHHLISCLTACNLQVCTCT